MHKRRWMQSPRMWSLFSSTQKWRAIELEESNTAALQITLFNQPWDFSAKYLKQHLLQLPSATLCSVLLQGRQVLLTGRNSPILTLVWFSHHRGKNLHFCCLCPGVKTNRSSKSKSGHLSEDIWGIFWATPVFPQYNKDNNQKYTDRDLYMVHSAHIPSDVTLLMYCSTHWKHLIFPCFWIVCSLFCWSSWQRTPLVWRTLKQNLT